MFNATSSSTGYWEQVLHSFTHNLLLPMHLTHLLQLYKLNTSQEYTATTHHERRDIRCGSFHIQTHQLECKLDRRNDGHI